MCYHVSVPAKEDLLEEVAPEVEVRDYEPYHHVSGFVRPFLPVMLGHEQGVIQPSRWKLLPHWVKTEAEAVKYANTLNADSSEIFERASYKPYILKNRGLLYINGFFEPHKVEGQKETENFYIYRPRKKLITLGIVYAPWTDKETGEYYNTFSVITVPANKELAAIHNEKGRMPLIISPEDHADWLNAKTKDEVTEFFKPYPDGELQSHRIAMRVTAIRKGDTNIPEIQQPA